MAYQNILTEQAEGVLTITINRPDKLNALNRDTIQEIGAAVAAANADPAISGIIITGSGEKAFAAGADIAEFSAFNAAQGEELARAGSAVFNSIEQSAKPVIAAVNGFALGGGCELAMACHLRLASRNAKFGQPEVNLGLIPGYAGTQRLVQLIGKGKALELLLTAGMIDAEEAHRLGLVNYVLDQDQLRAKAHEILQTIRSKGPLAVAAVIRCVNSYFRYDEDGFETEAREFGKSFDTEDFKEGTRAFMEKRKAAFSGR